MPQPRIANFHCQGVHTSMTLDTYGEFLEFVNLPLNKPNGFDMVRRLRAKMARKELVLGKEMLTAIKH